MGVKPANGNLRVRLNNSYLLASQVPVDANYSFFVDLLSGDSLTLESLESNGNIIYFTRMDVGNSGGTNNLSFEITNPTIDVDTAGAYYTISFNEVQDTSFYESYVLEIVQGVLNEPYQGVSITGEDIKIPIQLLNTDADELIIFLRAVKLDGYNQSDLLGDTLSFSNYSYGEINQTIISKKRSYANFNKNYSRIYLRIEG